MFLLSLLVDCSAILLEEKTAAPLPPEAIYTTTVSPTPDSTHILL